MPTTSHNITPWISGLTPTDFNVLLVSDAPMKNIISTSTKV